MSYGRVYLFHVFGLAIAFSLLYQKNRKHYFSDHLNWTITVPLAALGGSIVVGALISTHLGHYISYNLQIIFGLSLMMCCWLSAVDRIKMMRYLNYGFIANVIVGLFETFTPLRWPISVSSQLNLYLGKGYLTEGKHYQSFYSEFPSGFFWNPNNFALVVLCGLPFYLNAKIKPVYKVVMWMVVLLLIVRSGARGAVPFLFLYTIYFLLKRLRTFDTYRLNNISAKKVVIGCAIILSASFLMFKSLTKIQSAELHQVRAAFTRYFSGIYHMSDIINNEQSLTADEKNKLAGDERVRILAVAARKIKENPIFGLGPGGNRAVIGKVLGIQTTLESPHFYWVEICVNYGLIGLCMYLLWYFSVAFQLFKMRTDFSAALFESLSLFFFVSTIIASALYFLPKWILYGIAVKELKNGRK